MNNIEFGDYSVKDIYFQQMKPIYFQQMKRPNPSVTGEATALNVMSAASCTTKILSPFHLKILH